MVHVGNCNVSVVFFGIVLSDGWGEHLTGTQNLNSVGQPITVVAITAIAENSSEAKIRGFGIDKEQGVRDRWLQRCVTSKCRRLPRPQR